MKKLITAILVLVILVSMVVLPAAAATVQPKGAQMLCPYCGLAMECISQSTYNYVYHCYNCNIDIVVAK